MLKILTYNLDKDNGKGLKLIFSCKQYACPDSFQDIFQNYYFDFAS